MATFYVVRHAKAGHRTEWTGDDRLRPLSKKGMDQAERLVGVLEPFPIRDLYSSPYLRCVQTIAPLGRARGVAVQESTSLGEGHGLAGAMKFMGDPELDQTVLCTHADIVWELLDELVKRRVIQEGEGGFDKASTWLVEMTEGKPVRARYLPAP